MRETSFYGVGAEALLMTYNRLSNLRISLGLIPDFYC
jgi:hypothetical protein